MQIKEVTGGYVTIEIPVSTCLAIASACHLASTSAGDDGYPIHDYTFELLRSAFAAFAVVAAASCHMKTQEWHYLKPEKVAADWGRLPHILDGKEVTR